MSPRLRTTLIVLAIALLLGLGAFVRSLDLDSPSVGSPESAAGSPRPEEAPRSPDWERPEPQPLGSSAPLELGEAAVESPPSTRSSLPDLQRSLHLRVVDRVTGEPVPAVEVSLRIEGPGELTEGTDGEGRIRFDLPAHVEGVELRAHDLWAGADLEFGSGSIGPTQLGEATFARHRIDLTEENPTDPSDPIWDFGSPEDPRPLTVDVGPTFRLRVRSPETNPLHIGFLMQGLDIDDNRWPLKELRPLPPGDPSAEPSIESSVGPSIENDLWVLRYRTSFMDHDPRAPRRIVVFSEPAGKSGKRFEWDVSRPPDGVPVGTVEVDLHRGIYPEVLEVQLSEQMVLRGRTLDAVGDPLAGCELLLLREDRPDHLFLGGSTSGLHETSEGNGHFWLPGVTPGRYRLYVRHDDHWPLAFDLDVASGREDLGDIVLEPVALGGDLAGELRLPGQVDGLLILNVVCIEGPPFSRNLWLEADDAGVASFRVPDLPVGTYRLEPLTLPRMAATPATLTASPPRSDLRIELSMPEDSHPMRIQARDRAEGSRVEGLRLIFKIAGRWSLEAEPSKDLETPFWTHDPSDGLEAIVWAEGYRAAHLDHSNAVLEEGQWVWKVEMDRGRSAVVFARHAQAAIAMGELDLGKEGAEFASRPVEGIEFTSQRGSLGRTDRDGLLIAPLDPGDVGLAARADDHVLVGSRGLWNGSLVGEDPLILLWYGDR